VPLGGQFLLGDCLSGGHEGGGDEGDDDVGVVGGAGVLGFEVVLVGDLGEVGSGDVDGVGGVGRREAVGAQSPVEVVEGSGHSVVSLYYADHQSNYQLLLF
jgi:hypothetical protein